MTTPATVVVIAVREIVSIVAGVFVELAPDKTLLLGKEIKSPTGATYRVVLTARIERLEGDEWVGKSAAPSSLPMTTEK